MKSKMVLWLTFLFAGCTLFPAEEYRYLPLHEDAALLRNYTYSSYTTTSVVYEVEVSALAWYNSDFVLFENEFTLEGDGTFEVLDFDNANATLTGNSSTVLLIDQSGSYLELDPFNNRSKAINKFLEDFVAPGEFMLGGFSASGMVTTPVEYASDNFSSSWVDAAFLFGLAERTGGTSSLYDALDNALDKLSSSLKPDKNLVVMIHAADAGSSVSLAEVITKANLNNVKIHVIVFGDQPLPSEVWSIAEQTDGMFALCENDSDLITVFDNLERLLNIYSAFNTLTIQFTPTAGNVLSGNEYETWIRLTDSYSGYEFNPVYVKVKIP